ncbi:Transposase, Mutator family [Bradyrhizobium erythrophlei]|nr:Transposase, Mutator family [Bradyrhizobium erythrophlei]
MFKDNIIKLIQPGNVDDQLTEILRSGARSLLAQAVEAEVADFLGKHADLKTADGHQRVVRHGHLPEREVMIGIGPVAVRQPRVRDREADAADPDRIRFSPSILPPYMRRSKSIETLLPILYLKGISTGDFSEVSWVERGPHCGLLSIRGLWLRHPHYARIFNSLTTAATFGCDDHNYKYFPVFGGINAVREGPPPWYTLD